ncbi:MAG: SufE family protein [Synechococcaceae bacterium WBA_2_066]|nr:SufE family protein [Synechococcaceae bacterium WB6_1A_059]NBP32159.1 SufE family protein [Synechococcaceae bacterium WB6_1B_055]NBR43625.1 SufE family protein [Synechococcaceae bacterium WB5_2B_268]NBY60419.1 SufE family protein [Synechococcaceae bacterium LLD_019]NCY13979.1 SufE family protein [Synechococcaceae bacterium WB8_1A_041]NDA74620.1 SufE family protein [Synechococcaceae bacterium WB8_3_299]NDC05874.1 SufE family protein [Synechococcaceae bacterium WB9_2_069]NDE21938.1 SufE fam
MASGSAALDEIVAKLKGSSDPKRRYEYVLWLAKKLPPAPAELQCESNRVKGCVSQVFVQPQLDEGLLQWQGDADAQITKGLLALLITGLNGLSAAEVVAIDPSFMAETGLQASLTPSRANGFLNILLHMQAQAAALAATA